MCPVEYGVDMRVTTLFTILRLRRGERESAAGGARVRWQKRKSRTGLGEGDRGVAFQDVPADVRLLRSAGVGRRFTLGACAPGWVEEDRAGASGGQTSLICSVGNELREKAVHGLGHGSARGRESGHEHRGAARRDRRVGGMSETHEGDARVSRWARRGEVRGRCRRLSLVASRRDGQMEQMERDRMSDPRRARASHAPGAAVRKFHALMHPLVARLKRRKRQVAERVLHVGPRPRARPTACVGEKTATFHTCGRPFALSPIFSRQNDHKRSPPFYDAIRIILQRLYTHTK